MKITESQLKKIIQEEISNCLKEEELLNENLGDLVNKLMLLATLATPAYLAKGFIDHGNLKDAKAAVESVLADVPDDQIEAVRGEVAAQTACAAPSAHADIAKDIVDNR